MNRRVPQAFLENVKDATKGVSELAGKEQDALHREIGAYIAGWATTESSYQALLSRLLDCSSDNASVVFHSVTTSRARMALLASLARLNLSEGDQKVALGLVARFKGPTRLRNELAHSEYVYLPPEYRPSWMTTINLDRLADGKEFRTRKPYSKGRMNELTRMRKEMMELNRDIWAFCDKLDAAKSGA